MAESAGLVDPFGRPIEYLRLSVTDRCDLRCSYCLPKGFREFDAPEHWLTFAEIVEVVAAFAALGVHRVRLTGGEPLLRKGLPELATQISRAPGVKDLSLSTNAVRLDRYASQLRAAGVSRINVSLDSLDPARYREITGGGRLDKVLAGLEAAKRAGFGPIKINMVVMAGVNDDEIDRIVEFCLEEDFTLRLIEPMPMGATGLGAQRHHVDLGEVRQRLGRRFQLIPDVVPGGGPASYVRVAGTNLRIGFITPISQHFCATCNRVRLSVDGTLYLCLGQEHCYDLRQVLRDPASPMTLETAIRDAIARKPERHTFREEPGKIVRFMSVTGG